MMFVLEIVAALSGLLAVWLTVRQNIWCWPVGLVMVILYGIIFFDALLYSDAGLQGIYFFLQFYGWWAWLNGRGRDGAELPVTRLDLGERSRWIAVALAGTVGLGWVMSTYTEADLAYWDASTTVLSLVATYLMARKKLECWFVWIAVDILAIGIYSVKELYLTAGLYAVFLVLAIMGFFAWKKSESAGT